MPDGMVASLMPSKLHQLAIQLKLNQRMQKFCELLAADPRRNQTAAAIAVGYSAPSAAVMGSKLMRDDRVIKYLMALDQMALEASDARKIADVRESLEILSAQARSELPTKVKKAEGVVVEEEYDSGKAVSRLMDHHEGAKEAGQQAVFNGNVLIQLLQNAGADGREAVRGLLRSGSTTPVETDAVDAEPLDEPASEETT